MGESDVVYRFSAVRRVGTPHADVVQGSAVYPHGCFQECHARLLEQQNCTLLFLVESFRCCLSGITRGPGNAGQVGSELGPLCSCPGVAGGEWRRQPPGLCWGAVSPPLLHPQGPSPPPLPAPITYETPNAEKWKKWLNLVFHSCLRSQRLPPINHSCDCIGPRKLPTKD